jgi:hypothetical protein
MENLLIFAVGLIIFIALLLVGELLAKFFDWK